ncbi:MAG: UvrD-helicase domain-containing protein [Rhodocyclaceae bacterium]|nr:UvrD-helicase domain-containing protein [Rhodocyclaceae bacterium]
MTPGHADLLAADAAARERALEVASFAVEAPAGAGKTELLTQRVLRLLALVEEPEEVVAITFTHKAAGEMRDRILEALAAAPGAPPEKPHKRRTWELARAALAVSAERGWGLTGQPGRLRLMTIDAFCMGLARQMPVLSRFGAQPRLAERAAAHYAEAARRTLALLEDAPEAIAALVAAALRHLDNDAPRLAELLAAMLARRDQWLANALRGGAGEAMAEALAALVGRDLADARQALGGDFLAAVHPLARRAGGRVDPGSPIAVLADWDGALAGDAAGMPVWRALCELLLTAKNEPRRRLTAAEGFPPEEKEDKRNLAALLEAMGGDMAAALARARGLPDPAAALADAPMVEALARLLHLAAGQLLAVFQEAGEVDFIEVARRSLAALGSDEAPTDLALRLDYRIRHLLVDEFQDTSPVQVRLLERLTAGWAPGDGRTLFVVGDPMQSVYRFRQAEVGLFLRVAGGGLPGLPMERLSLYRNNRSRPEVVDWVNDTFPAVFPRRDDDLRAAVRYRPCAPTREPGGQGATGIRVHAVVLDRAAPKEAGEQAEAAAVLAAIAAERAARPEARIAVLVRARRHLAPLVAEIRARRPDLRYTAVEIEALAERQAVEDLASLARALHHRADRVHWLAILRAPWVGLTLADLHALAGDDHGATLWCLMNDAARVARLSADGQRRLAHARGILGEALGQRGRQGLRRRVEGTWRALGGAGLLRDAAEADDAGAFLDLLDRLDEGGGFSPEALDAALGELRAGADPEADGRLQFMTIHKAKGLEFDVVVLPGLHRPPARNDTRLLRWEEVPGRGLDEALVAAPWTRASARAGGTYAYLEGFEQERQAREAGRLLYVAATRARERLHLAGVLRRSGKGELRPPAGSFLALLWSAVEGAFAAAPELAAPEGDAGGAPVAVPDLLRAAVPAMPAEFAAAGIAAPAGAPPEGAEEEGGPSLDADVGTLVHAYLERIARDGPDAWPGERVAALAPAMALWLARQGHGEDAVAAGVARARAALEATLRSAAGRWVLAPRPEAAVELALSRAEARGASHHIVDRTFAEEGVRWIVDYKTARIEGDAAAWQAHAEGYREQLARYAGLFADEGLPVRAAILYTAEGRLVEVEI